MNRYLLILIMMAFSSLSHAGGTIIPPMTPSLPSEQDSIFADCLNNGIALDVCPANRSPIPFTNNQINQTGTNTNNAPSAGNGNGNNNNQTSSLNDISTPQGLNAGMDLGQFGIWANVSHTNSEYSLIPWEADSSAATVGIHKNVGPSGIMGISFGLGGSEVETLFNGGEQEFTDYNFAVYGSTLVTNNISIGANAGYIYREMEQFRLGVGAGGFGLGERIIGGTESDTWFASANIDGYWQVQAFSLGSHASVLYSTEEIDGFTETGTSGATNSVSAQDNDVGVLRLGFDVGYTNPGFIEPYMGLDYLYYFENQSISAVTSNVVDNDDSEFVWSLGARFYRDNITGSISYSNNFSREFLDYDTFNASITIDL